jgi:hypothetical protein
MAPSVGHSASRVYGIPQRLGRWIVTSVDASRGVVARRETLASGTAVSQQAKHQAPLFRNKPRP